MSKAYWTPEIDYERVLSDKFKAILMLEFATKDLIAFLGEDDLPMLNSILKLAKKDLQFVIWRDANIIIEAIKKYSVVKIYTENNRDR